MSLVFRFSVLLAAAASSLTAGEIFGPRISFPRVQPAPVNLGAMRTFNVAEVKGGAGREAFSRRFAEVAERDELLKVKGDTADALLYVTVSDCSTVARHNERHRDTSDDSYWYDTRCTARVRIADSRTKGTVSEYEVSAHASSRREKTLSIDLKNEAEREAIEQLGEFAAAKITPRKLMDSIRLDNTAPSFDAGYALVRDGRFAEARQLWSDALKKNPSSASLRFDLGAVCEALGDNAAAKRLYEEAIKLDSLNDRYGKALEELDQRAAEAAQLKVRPSTLR